MSGLRILFINALLITLFSSMPAFAQDSFDVVIMRDADSLTIYVPGTGNVSLKGLGFESVDSNRQKRTVLLESYPAFSVLQFDNLPAPICLRLIYVRASVGFPMDCQKIIPGNHRVDQPLNETDIFWFDPDNKQGRMLNILHNGQFIDFCPPQPSCTFKIPVPIPTSTPPLPRVFSTITPLPTQLPIAPAAVPPPPSIALTTRITSNDQWQPQPELFDNVEMVLVPPGCFMMGTKNPPPPKSHDDEKPDHQICFEKPFWIDKTEVTQAQARKFGGVGKGSAYPGNDRPIEKVTWYEARAYCVKRHVRLPTEPEWEYAARGPSNLIYPWGNQFDPKKTIFNRREVTGTDVVGILSSGTSWVGALDMSGNVAEWTNSLYRPYPYQAGYERESSSDPRVVRGGAWDSSYDILLRAANRVYGDPSERYDDIGFRCARNY